jgi:lysophospholipase L1-like esterase
MTKFLVFGASIVQGFYDKECGGWPNRLDMHNMNNNVYAPVFNLGISGNT